MKQDMQGVSILMPCLNEEKTVGICIKKAQKFLEEHQLPGEVLVVDNNSMDASAEIKKWLEAGDCVLLDRYVYSNIAYQCSKIMMQPQFGENRRKMAQELRNWIFDTEYNKYGIPKPDLNLFLDVPISFVDSKLKESRSGDDDRDYLNGKEDIHEADIQFQIYVREMYLEQTRADEGFVRVHCEDAQGNMLPPDDIFHNIREQVKKLF